MKIAHACPDDAEAIADLLDEVDRFYGATDIEARTDRLEQIDIALWRDHPAARALLAWEGTALVGLASYSFLWPAAGTSRSLYLKELYVTAAHRGQGIGTRLMAELAHIAIAEGCSRVEWTADADNPNARAFYEHLNVPHDSSKLFYRLGADLLKQAGRKNASDDLRNDGRV